MDMYALYIVAHLIVAIIAPLFFAVLLPVTALTALVINQHWRQLAKPLTHPLFLTTALIALLLLITCLYAPFPKTSLEDAAQTGLLLLCFAFLWAAKPEGGNQLTASGKKLVLGLFLLLSVILLLLVIALSNDWLTWHKHELNRQLAVFCAFFWPLSLLFQERSERRILIIIYFQLISAVIIGASETALLMITLSTVTVLMFRFIPLGKTARTALFAVMTIGLISTPVIIAAITDPSITQTITELLGSKVHHYKIWVLSLNEAIANFPLGTGISTTPLLETPETIEARGFKRYHPHNFVLELILELGLLGLILIGLTVWLAVRLFRKAPTEAEAEVAATLISLFTLYSTTFSLWQEWRTGFTAFSLIIIGRHLQNLQQPAIHKAVINNDAWNQIDIKKDD